MREICNAVIFMLSMTTEPLSCGLVRWILRSFECISNLIVSDVILIQLASVHVSMCAARSSIPIPRWKLKYTCSVYCRTCGPLLFIHNYVSELSRHWQIANKNVERKISFLIFRLVVRCFFSARSPRKVCVAKRPSHKTRYGSSTADSRTQWISN